MSAQAALDFYEAFLASYASVLGVDAVPARDDGRVVLQATDATYVAGAPRDAGGRTLLIGPGVSHGIGQATTAIDTESRRIAGVADRLSNRLVNELRRYGIRFYSRPRGDRYADWSVQPPDPGSPAGS
jgi:hypothetical protein